MMPCSPAMTFCSMVGHASFHTAGPMGPSTMDRSNLWGFAGGVDTNERVYRIRETGLETLDVQLVRLLGAIHDDAEPSGRVLPHQLVDHAIGNDLIGDLDALQPARLRVERRLPQHLRHHLAEPLG